MGFKSPDSVDMESDDLQARRLRKYSTVLKPADSDVGAKASSAKEFHCYYKIETK